MKYRAIFFDWDGTAVASRKAPVDAIIPSMKKLLEQGVKLIIISGTTYENIADGKLHQYFSKEILQNLYLGLGRGAYHYGFHNGLPFHKSTQIPGADELIKIHKVSYLIHEYLLSAYRFHTDIVFSRPNYCKLDLMVDSDRGDQLFLQTNEIDSVQKSLKSHGIERGLEQLISIAVKIGLENGLTVAATTDAKYLEVGMTTKSDNVDFFVKEVLSPERITMEECCFWGDEFTYLSENVSGSDSYMITELTKDSRFFDVSASPVRLPSKVVSLGGGVERFGQFMMEQSKIYPAATSC